MNFQTWICPKCHDDHRQDGPCSPSSSEMFMPAQEDRTYIAEQYRLRRSDLAAAQAREWTLEKALATAQEAALDFAKERDQLRAELARLTDVKDAVVQDAKRLCAERDEWESAYNATMKSWNASQAEVAELRARVNENAEHFLACRDDNCDISYCVTRRQLATRDAECATLRAAVEFARQHAPLCGHDDPTWCEDKCRVVWVAKRALAAAPEPAILQAVRRMREGLKFYAHQEHFSGLESFESVSGEPEQYLCSTTEKCDVCEQAVVEDGAAARQALADAAALMGEGG